MKFEDFFKKMRAENLGRTYVLEVQIIEEPIGDSEVNFEISHHIDKIVEINPIKEFDVTLFNNDDYIDSLLKKMPIDELYSNCDVLMSRIKKRMDNLEIDLKNANNVLTDKKREIALENNNLKNIEYLKSRLKQRMELM